jgi:hypothetical protein
MKGNETSANSPHWTAPPCDRIGLMDANFQYLGAILARADADEQAEFFRAFIAECNMLSLVQAIIAQKYVTGPSAYLWAHSTGDVILWPDEKAAVVALSSENDPGVNAIDRWQLDDAELDELLASGVVDEEA